MRSPDSTSCSCFPQVSATVILHGALQFRNDVGGVVGNRLQRDLGNATKDTELTFEYSNKVCRGVAWQ